MQPTTNPVPQPPEQQSDGSDIHKFVVLQPGEKVICQIRRHPFGLFGIYASSGIMAIIVLSAAFAVPSFVSGLSKQADLGIMLGAAIFATFIALFTYVATYVYNANRWIITSDSITQITQTSLFSKETSQLSLANLEDVTVDQNGILQSMFGFGTLHAESAGAQGKFFFMYCPNPSDYARKVIAAHEAYIATKPEETVTANRPLATTTQFNQPWQQPPQPPAGMPPTGTPQA
jgi:hypothetical protein